MPNPRPPAMAPAATIKITQTQLPDAITLPVLSAIKGFETMAIDWPSNCWTGVNWEYVIHTIAKTEAIAPTTKPAINQRIQKLLGKGMFLVYSSKCLKYGPDPHPDPLPQTDGRGSPSCE